MPTLLLARKALDAPNVEKLDSLAPRQRSSLWLAGALILALLAGPRWALASPVTLMSYNLYLGADLAPVLASQTEQEFVVRAGMAFGGVQATDFNQRASAIADQIALTKPHFIGLQEVVTWSTGGVVAFDYLQILSDALSAKGLSYTPIAQVQNLDIVVPGLLPTGLTSIGLTDSDVLLAMTDLPGGITYANTQSQNFATTLPVPVLGTTIEIPRGWTAADVTVDGKTFRLVNTHLEGFFEPVQLGQALELLGGPGNTALPLVFIGDFNSDAAPPAGVPGATYGLFLGPGGFTDAGLLGGIGGDPTCCQAADLLNDPSDLLSRLDLALFRGGFHVTFADVVGEEEGDRTTPAGLWPSDHAGIVVALKLPEPSTALLLLFGLALLVLAGRRGRSAAAA